MRILLPLTGLLFFLSACGGHKLSVGNARKAIIALPQETLEKEDIDVVDLTQITGSTAVAETRVKTAFLLQKEEGIWVVKEVRIGHGQWEEIKDLSEALRRVKTEETGKMLERISDAVREYHEATGSMPQFKDYVGLSDILAPKYLDPLIRLDSWRNPLHAETTGSGAIVVTSAGPDGRFNTDDDLRITITP